MLFVWSKYKEFFSWMLYIDYWGVMSLTNEELNKISDILLQSLYDYHFANNGASYVLPKAMVNTDLNSKQAIEYLIKMEYAVDSGQGSDNLVLGITAKGMEYLKNK